MQYVAVRYTERLAEAGLVASVGSTGDSYDNAMAEAFNSPFKAELLRNRGPWKNIDDLEIAVAEYIDAYTASSAWSHRLSTRATTATAVSPRRPAPREITPSTKPGTRQTCLRPLRSFWVGLVSWRAC